MSMIFETIYHVLRTYVEHFETSMMTTGTKMKNH